MTRPEDYRREPASSFGSFTGSLSSVNARVSQGSHSAPLPAIVSLFCGAGGLDLGFRQAGFSVAFAIDIDQASVRTHQRNFPKSNAMVGDLTKLRPRGVVEFVKASISPGLRIGVIGGPPCQGFSRANINSLASDPRNKLPKLYLEIVEALQSHYDVEFVVLENVLGIRDKKHSKNYRSILTGIADLGFRVTEKELCSVDYGVPQNRRRIVLAGMRTTGHFAPFELRKRKGPTTVRQVIGTLDAPAFFSRSLNPKDIPVHPNHWTMQPKSSKFQDPKPVTSGQRSFRRLVWDSPSPTIAFGHREIHVHPDGHRRLSIYEAMLLQGFPKEFVLEGNLSEQVQQVSNAVPPPLARSVALAVKRALRSR